MSSRFGNCNQARERAAPAMTTHPSGWTLEWVAAVKRKKNPMIVFTVSKYNRGWGVVFGAVERDGMNTCGAGGSLGSGLCVFQVQSVRPHAASAQASMGLDTMLFGVSGS